MPKPTYARCRNCGRHRSEAGVLSRTRLCAQCSAELFEANLDQLTTHSGPWFNHWRRRGAAAYGAVLLDDVLERP